VIKEIIPHFKLDSRRLIAAKTVTIFSLFFMGIFCLFNFIYHQKAIFFIDFGILILLLLSYLILIKKNIYLLGEISCLIMCLGLITLIYEFDGRDNIYLWTFTGTFYMMLLFGPKKGMFYTIIFFLPICYLMYNNIGVNITEQGFIRFIAVSVTLIAISFSYEYSIASTLSRLEKTQKNLEKMVKIDGLTNLFNRRYFDEIFLSQIKIARRNNKLLVFAMADIDNFKNYNDTYGHQAGDKVLQKVSSSFLSSMQRTDDYVFRLGGEEFGFLFQAENNKDCKKILEKICKNIEDLKIEHYKNSVSLHLTVSIGMHIIEPSDNYDTDTIYKITDDALYRAKLKGKNRVEEL